MNTTSFQPDEALEVEWELDTTSHTELKPEKMKEVVNRARSRADAIISKEDIMMGELSTIPVTVHVEMFKNKRGID